jgi:hypothetical protein
MACGGGKLTGFIVETGNLIFLRFWGEWLNWRRNRPSKQLLKLRPCKRSRVTFGFLGGLLRVTRHFGVPFGADNLSVPEGVPKCKTFL